MNAINVNTRITIDPSKVILVKGTGNYSIIYFSDGRRSEIFATTLKVIEERIGSDFSRINKSSLVNLNYIEKANKKEITLINGQKLIPSRRRKIEFYNVYQEHYPTEI